MMKNLWFKVFIILSIYLCSCVLLSSCSESVQQEVEQEVVVENYELGFNTSDFEEIEGQIKRGDFFGSLILRLGASTAQSQQLMDKSKGVFDLRNIRIGNPYRAYYHNNEAKDLAYLVYEHSKRSFVVFSLNDSVYVNVIERDIERRLRYSSATITSSLWVDMQRAGLSTQLAIKLSDLYAWSIDFFGLRAGDHFSVLYEELYIGDNFFDIGTIYSANFNHAGRDYDAFRFVQDETPQYWNSKGENLKKAFLKAPLNFTRISSGFTYARRHPVTRVVRPHTGVDYAAPAGTPVMSIGDGVVTQRAYVGAGGNTVKIRHNSTYTTAYLHLSRFASGLSVGKRVRQGEVIGYVGSTGVSTGPHLDFRVWKNGTPINPLTMESPPADPIKKENLELFRESVLRHNYLKDSLISQIYIEEMLNRLGVQN